MQRLGSERDHSTAADGESALLRRHRGLLGRTALVSGLTLASRLLGFVREVIMAIVFGDNSAISDAFFTAFRVPNLFRRLLGEGALSTALQAGLTEADANGGDPAGRRLFLRTVDRTTRILFVVLAVSMALVAFLPDRMPVTDWPWLGSDPAPVRELTLRLLPYVVFICLAALAGGALQVRGHYFTPNLAPAVMNIVWIVVLLMIAWSFDVHGGAADFEEQWEMARWLAWGVLVGGAVQLAVLVRPLLAHGLLGPTDGAPPASARGVLRTTLPLALGAAVYQVNVMIDGLMAEGLLEDGGPTALYYANRLQQFPLALVAIAAVNAVFPSLKANAHLGRMDEVRRLHDRAQEGVLFFALPAAVGLLLLAEPIAYAVFEHGNYGSEGTHRIAAALRMLALALVPAGAASLASRVYIAAGDLRTPVVVSSVLLVLNAGLNLVFVRGLGMDVEGLTLATAVTSWGNLLALSLLQRRVLGLPPGAAGRARTALGITLAAALAGAGALGVAIWIGPLWHGWAALAAAGAVGVGLHFGLASLLRLEPWLAFRARRRRA